MGSGNICHGIFPMISHVFRSRKPPMFLLKHVKRRNYDEKFLFFNNMELISLRKKGILSGNDNGIFRLYAEYVQIYWRTA